MSEAVGFQGSLSLWGGRRRPVYALSFRPLRVHVFYVGLYVGEGSYPSNWLLSPAYSLVVVREGSVIWKGEVHWVARVRALAGVEDSRHKSG